MQVYKKPSEKIELTEYALMATNIGQDPYTVEDFSGFAGITLKNDQIEIPGFIVPGTYSVSFSLVNSDTKKKAKFVLDIILATENASTEQFNTLVQSSKSDSLFL